MHRHAELSAFCLLLSFFTAGCGSSFSSADASSSDAHGVALTGSLYGGRQPITGAHVYLMSPGASGYGSASTSLLTTGDGTDVIGTYVTTSATGTFNITGDYTCTAGALVYVLAVGGNPGDGVNSAAVLADVLGPCPSSKTFAGVIPSISINELTTVAAAYSLSAFAKDGMHVGSSSTNLAGITSAFATAVQLVSPYTGVPYGTTPAVAGYAAASGLSGNGTVPYDRLSMIADILAACVNTSGPTSHNCSVLFNNATTGGTPTDIFTAAVHIAQNPAASSTITTNLFNIIPTTPPYNTTIASAPADMTLCIAFTAPGTSTPARSAIDASGNLWVPNQGANTLTELSPQGVVLSGTTGFTSSTMGHPWAVGIKPTTSSIMVANSTSNYISVFSSTGISTGQFGTFLNTPVTFYSIAFASDGTTYMGTNLGAYSITALGQIYNVFGTTTMYTAVLNSSGALYAASSAGNALVNASTSFSGGGLSAPAGIATDRAGNFWIANGSTNILSEFNGAGSPVSSTGYAGGGLNTSWGVAVDGDGKVFVSNGNGTLSEFSSTGAAMSPSTGYATGSSAGIYSTVLDNAGNVWAPATDGKIYKFVGLCAPVSLPLINTTVGVRP